MSVPAFQEPIRAQARSEAKDPAVSGGVFHYTKVGDVLLGDVLCPPAAAAPPSVVPTKVRPLQLLQALGIVTLELGASPKNQ